MATLLPNLPSCRKEMTSGEARFAERLLEKLEDDYLCWYESPVGPKHLRPDFIVLHPRRGLLVLEVKDWKRENIQRIDRHSVTLITNLGPKEVANPLEQARQYVLAAKSLLEQDPALRAEEGPHRGKLVMPYGYGVVFTNITRKAFEETDLGEVIGDSLVICRDEMTDGADPSEFQQRLWHMFKVAFPYTLSLPQIDRIRWHLFPEVRVTPGQSSLFPDPTEKDLDPSEPVPGPLRIMDLQQEQLARSLGEGHRVIHGVSGSGKTMILAYRTSYLVQRLAKPLLVLCYNVALATKLRQIIHDRGLAHAVSVHNFHAWCAEQLKMYHVPKPPDGDGFFDRLVSEVVKGVERGQIPRAQYGAVLVDEGHDFEPDWLRLAVQMVDPETNLFLLLYDDAQSIYAGQRPRRNFTFASVGIQARGRTTIMRLNYRNTMEVLAVAYEFAKNILTPREADEDGVPLVEPQSAGRQGPVPEFTRLPNLKAEVSFIANRLRQLHKEGRAWNEMAVIYRTKFVAEEAMAALAAAKVPAEWVTQSSSSKSYAPSSDSVKVITMHSSKGLEFPIVAIPGLGFMPQTNYDVAGEAKLLYIAMTRAMDQLIMTYHRESAFVERLRNAVELAKAA